MEKFVNLLSNYLTSPLPRYTFNICFWQYNTIRDWLEEIKMKRILALFLTLSLLLSLCTVAFAATDEAINYVSLGDSTSMGYLMNDFCDGYVRMNYYDNVSNPYSDYVQFKTYLENQGYTVNGTDLCMNGMRPSELRAILYTDYKNEQFARTENFCENHIEGYSRGKGETYESYDEIQSVYTEALKNADIITYDILMGDFGLNFIDRMSALLSGGDSYYTDAGETFVQIMEESDRPEIVAGAKALNDKVLSVLGDKALPLGVVEHIIDAVLYTYAHFAINFSWTMDWIYNNNPNDVTVIVVGPTNPLDYLTVSYNGIEINVSQIWGYITEALTHYAVKGDPHADRYLFADCSAGVDSFVTAFAANQFKDDAYTYYRDLFYGDIAEMAKLDPDFVKTALDSPDVRAIISQNIQSACSLSSYDVNDLLQGFSGGSDVEKELIKALLAGTDTILDDFSDETPSSLGQTALWFFILSQARGAGGHPSANGYAQKLSYIINAYERGCTARTTYLIRAVKTARYLVTNTVGTLMGSKTSYNNLTALFTRLFTPVIDLSALLGNLLKK